MKRCPVCSQVYNDDSQNFCLNDGELLVMFDDGPPPTIFSPNDDRSAEDSPPTVLLDRSRVTNQTNWQPQSGPVVPWQTQQPMPGLSFGMTPSRDQTLPTISLVLGSLSVVMICCYGGLWLGLPAAIVGYIGMRNADSDPTRYGGRGLAIGGMVAGIITFLAFLGWIALILMGSLV
jgi:hypothetical protein